MFFMVGLYEGGARYVVRFEPLADFSQAPANAAEREARVAEAMQAYVAQLEALCRAHPYNWFNFHDFWREEDAA
jgi:predicted LPLAT superfamily acyltransferase